MSMGDRIVSALNEEWTISIEPPDETEVVRIRIRERNTVKGGIGLDADGATRLIADLYEALGICNTLPPESWESELV